MNDRKWHIDQLFTAELQFRLASAVRLATTLNAQPLDLPMEWTHGKHTVTYGEIALRQDQADFAAHFLHQSATFLMAVAIEEALRRATPDSSSDPSVHAAKQIAFLVRNAFSHGPFSPVWTIGRDSRNVVFTVPDIIELNTAGLHGTPFDWRHYGGPLALYRLCRFVRVSVLRDDLRPRKVIPKPSAVIHQVGDLILKRVDEIPPDAVPVKPERTPDGGIKLPGGYIIGPSKVDRDQ